MLSRLTFQTVSGFDFAGDPRSPIPAPPSPPPILCIRTSPGRIMWIARGGTPHAPPLPGQVRALTCRYGSHL
ncbi:hypothetical protein BGC30_00445 [Novacetimonas hansenii]|nr:hypothetical protein BGC30_00445 [Novacetimonas hansenii]